VTPNSGYAYVKKVTINNINNARGVYTINVKNVPGKIKKPLKT